MGMLLFSPFFTLTIILVGLLQLFSSWSSSTTVNAWTVPLPGGRKVSYRDGILRIQVEDEATVQCVWRVATDSFESLVSVSPPVPLGEQCGQ